MFSAGSAIDCSAESSKTQLEIRSQTGTRYVVRVGRDADVPPTAVPMRVEIIGEVKDVAIILADTYPSMPGDMSYCQAGEERFLRIIAISQKPPEETLRLKIESCRDNLELASPGIEWLPESSLLRIHWLLGPAAKGLPEVRTIRIGADGRPH